MGASHSQRVVHGRVKLREVVDTMNLVINVGVLVLDVGVMVVDVEVLVIDVGVLGLGWLSG